MDIRKARTGDVKAVQALVNLYAGQGLMLPRPLSMLYEGLRDFVVAADGDEVLGAGALHIVWEDLAEIRALAIKPPLRRGVGRRIVDALVEEARALDIGRLFTLTYQVEFFERCGFQVVGKEQLPHKVWTECINCSKFPACDEVAMDRVLIPGRGSSLMVVGGVGRSNAGHSEAS